jgi:hypothetical protein
MRYPQRILLQQHLFDASISHSIEDLLLPVLA